MPDGSPSSLVRLGGMAIALLLAVESLRVSASMDCVVAEDCLSGAGASGMTIVGSESTARYVFRVSAYVGSASMKGTI